MKSPARSILALTLIATTLCAGRLFASDAGTQPQSRVATEKLVERLTRGLSRSIGRTAMATRLMVQPRSAALVQPKQIARDQIAQSACLSPLKIALPPPAL